MNWKWFFLIVNLLWLPIVQAQPGLPDTLIAYRFDGSIKVDGRLDETAWNQARKISNFTQREPDEGAAPTERTAVAVVYNQENLYIGVWCYDDQPDKLTAKEMQRDFSFWLDDDFEIIIDTYHDSRNGYRFVTNPNGARADALILDNGRWENSDWDGVWTVGAQITAAGWFVEFEIPFATLKFPAKPEQVWGINFERNIRRKREQVLWQAWSRDSDLEQLSRAGTLVGLKNLRQAMQLEFKPYATAGLSDDEESGQSSISAVGGDLNYLLSPTVKLNLAAHPDFAQVESDRVQINLNRFSLYYPEKREFFLEGRNYFDFGLGHAIQSFYSRRIGLSPDRELIPIIGGARLLGKWGNATGGGMVIQTAEKDTIPTANYSVLRFKQNVLEQSSVGIIAAGKIEPGRYNVTYGSDFLYSTSHFLKDKELFLGGAYAQSYTSDAVHPVGQAHHVFISFPSDFVEYDAIWERSSEDFNPEVGYLRRTNYQLIYSELQFNPRPAFLPWMRQLEFKPMDFDYYFDDNTGDLISFYSEYRPLGFQTESGEYCELNVQRTAENLTEDFEIAENVVIPVGEYWYTHYEAQFGTFRGRPLYGFIFVNWGDFYNGKRTEWFTRIVHRLSRHLNLSFDLQQNIVHLPAGNFTISEVGGRADFSFTPDLFGSVFGQWNDEDEEMILNFRVNWIPKPGTDLYFVANQTIDTENPYWHISNTTVLTKFVWRFVL